MSWNNVLPYWVYEIAYEKQLAQCACAFENEWFSGFSKFMPDYVQDTIIYIRNNG